MVSKNGGKKELNDEKHEKKTNRLIDRHVFYATALHSKRGKKKLG